MTTHFPSSFGYPFDGEIAEKTHTRYKLNKKLKLAKLTEEKTVAAFDKLNRWKIEVYH